MIVCCLQDSSSFLALRPLLLSILTYLLRFPALSSEIVLHTR
jgi:hypothetical protein